MENFQTYCEAVSHLPLDDVHRVYHDTEYGFPIVDDNELFGRLILEINQAGLSWTTILKKQENFRQAYEQFDVARVASYGEEDRKRLLTDAGIIRNRLKIDAVIHNAQIIQHLQKESTSFKSWLDQQGVLARGEWVKLFKMTFRFTGGEITNEFLVSTGYLPGAHDRTCPIFDIVIDRQPAWLKHSS